MNALGQHGVPKICTPQPAVEHFLTTMAKVTARTFPDWLAVLKEGLDDCPMDFETRRSVFDVHPLDDYYFAGIVGMEAAKIRGLFGPQEATELLSAIAEQVDAAAGRKDRIVSSIVFEIIGKLDLITPESHKMPYDEVIRILLHRMGIDTTAATRHVMNNTLLRHHLGEPLALGVPPWWAAFRNKFTLVCASAEHPGEIAIPRAPGVAAPAPAPPPKMRKVAQRLI